MSPRPTPRPESADTRPDVDVAIVGAGPVGLALAALLDRQGLTSMVFERRATLHRDPQAHVINTRTMEILRELGLGSAVQAAASPPVLMRSITWCESLAGLELGRIRLQGDDAGGMPARLALSPVTMANLAQNRLEPMLLDVVRRAPRSEVFFEHEVVSVEETGDGVTVRVRSGAREQTRTASVVVACDGAGSAVRRSLGIEMIGPASLQKFVSVYFEADLRRWIGDRPGPLFWIAGARTRGAVIGFDLDRTWALMVPYADPHTAEDFTDEVVRRMVADAIGDPDASFRITSVGNWNMSAQIAERYRAGRLFLAGDAAHRFPPTGGLGMNTGIQDAHNLAWKLAAVLRGDADPALLDTYEPERRTVAQTNCDQSVMNAMRMIEVDMVLGAPTLQAVDPGPIARDERPSIDFGMDGDGDAAVAKRRAVQEVIQSQAEHFDFTGLDLGFFYESGAVIADGSQAPAVDVRHYHPTTRPGSRLPHAWVTRLGTRVSTLDAAGPGRFTVLTGSAGQAWVDAARSIVRDSGLELGAARIVGVGDAAQPGDLVDADGGWAAVRGTDDAGALLVRPDGHVACRWPGAASDREDATRLLGDALGRLLGSAFRNRLPESAA